MWCIGKSGERLEREETEYAVEALCKHIDPSWVGDALRETGRESLRRRMLPAEFMVWFVILLGLFRRVSYANLLEKVDGSWWLSGRWGPQGPATTSAVTRARDRLGVEPLKALWRRSAREWLRSTEGLFFRGRRVYAVDGSTFKAPDASGNRHAFGKPGSSRGGAAYPQMRGVLLLDLGARLVVGERHGPYAASELALTRGLLGDIPTESLVLLDRNFTAYDILWDLRAGGRDFLLRLRDQRRFRVVKRLGPSDAIVEAILPRHYRKERPDMPRGWVLRMVSYLPVGSKEEVRLLTTLTEEEIPCEELAKMYHSRWGEETAIDEIKTHLMGCHTVNQPVVFRGRTSERVEQEWYGMLMAYNAVRRIIAEAAVEVGRPAVRLSFICSVERLRETTYEMMRLGARSLPGRYARMLMQIGRAVVLERPGRKNPRAVRVKLSKYSVKRNTCAA